MKKRVTSQDVADHAGVSRTTVSFVLNDVKGISIRPETRNRVLDASRELGYVPNASARALASNQANTIGLLMTRAPHYIATDIFLPQILGGILDTVKTYRTSLLIEWVEPGQQMETYLELTQAKHIDGMILMVPRLDDSGLNAIEQAEIPAVIMGKIPTSKLYSVDIDNTESAAIALRHLLKLGHRNIGCITNASTLYSSAAQRLEGYYLAFEEVGLEPPAELVIEADFNSQSGYFAMKELLIRNPKLTAAFVASDNVAVGAMQAVYESGRKIPDDFSIVGFDDIPMSAHLGPGLTTIHVPAREIASQSCHLLMRIMQGEAPESRSITLSTDLIVRNSTAVLRGDTCQTNVVSMSANQKNV